MLRLSKPAEFTFKVAGPIVSSKRQRAGDEEEAGPSSKRIKEEHDTEEPRIKKEPGIKEEPGIANIPTLDD
jgi:hypothetical protein